jgi:hypothetical protein
MSVSYLSLLAYLDFFLLSVNHLFPRSITDPPPANPPDPVVPSNEGDPPVEPSVTLELPSAGLIRDELLAALSTSVPRATEATTINPTPREIIRRPLSAPGFLNP